MTRKLIIVWKWDESDLHLYAVENDKSSTCYPLNCSDISVLQSQILEIEIEKNDNIIILLHSGDPNHFQEEDTLEVEKWLKENGVERDFKFEIFIFGGGGDSVYYNKNEDCGLLDQTGAFKYNADDGFSVLENKEIKNKYFDCVWKYYWEVKSLKEQKKKLIDTFLPLAIDMQGLSEDMDTDKREKYKDQVLEDLSKNAQSIIKNWQEIKKNLGLETKKNESNDSQIKKYGFTTEETNKLYFPGESKDNPNFLTGDTLACFVESNGISEPKVSLPEWLKQAVDIIDAQLKK